MSAISRSFMKRPEAMKRSPAMPGAFSARTCRSATSRTSTTPKPKSGQAPMLPSSSFFTTTTEAE